MLVITICFALSHRSVGHIEKLRSSTVVREYAAVSKYSTRQPHCVPKVRVLPNLLSPWIDLNWDYTELVFRLPNVRKMRQIQCTAWLAFSAAVPNTVPPQRPERILRVTDRRLRRGELARPS